ncbi:MAG: chemotaxis protein CheA [Spirochaetes bacterium]|nr:chemotaxis protein CheA [Spirochaetota bacterium]
MDDAYKEKLAAAFREECADILSELEISLLALERNPEDILLISKIFRALHTIKGSGAMAGFNDISSFTHSMESIYDLVRNNKLPVTKHLIDITLKAGDYIEKLLNTPGTTGEKEFGDTILTEFKKITGGIYPDAEKKPEEKEKVLSPPKNSLNSSADKEKLSVFKVFKIEFKPPENIFLRGINPLNMIDELKDLGHIECRAYTDKIPDFADINPELCYISWDITLTTDKNLNALKDVFIFIEDDSELNISVVKEKQKDLNITADKNPTGRLLKGSDSSKKKVIPKRTEKPASIRVSSDKLDNLVNLVGELIISQARLDRISRENEIPGLRTVSEEIENLTAELRENTMKLRMIPIGDTFDRFQRLVRDLSNELHKDVKLKTIGGNTELDKNIMEHLHDPLVHLIRNCMDHGIEPPEQRKNAGKPETGSIILKASYSGAYVLIEVSDDGAGMDLKKLKESAVKKGIIPEENKLSETEIYDLIFEPGFSTAGRITGLSGRGVGMDIVKRVIDSLDGSIMISTEKGKGTTITLKIPLTLAIIEGLLIRVGDRYFIIPLSAVKECFEYTGNTTFTEKKNILSLRGSLLPYISLRKFFDIRGNPPEFQQMVVTQVSDSLIGYIVDEVEGQYQTVIKSLGRIYRDLEGISGATILGDGTVALILDVLKLAQLAEQPA